MKKKSNFTTILLILILIVGLSLLLYPSVSDYWNSLHQSEAIASYAEDVENLDEEKYKELWEAAEAHNASLVGSTNTYILTEAEYEEYENLLNPNGRGIMGYVEIPKINCSLPIYHGTDKAVLQIAVGHLEWSSLPVGGESTHCVISGHRGVPRAKLFTNLDKLVVGDTFMLRVLDQVLTYEVDQILIVEPDEVDSLNIEEGKDYCTLVTCTPYSVNTHRLLVRGHRVENAESAKNVRLVSEAMQVDPVVVAPVIALPILLILLIFLMLPKRRKSIYDRFDEIDIQI